MNDSITKHQVSLEYLLILKSWFIPSAYRLFLLSQGVLREADESNRGLQSEVQKMEAQLEHLQDQLNQQGEANGQLREIIQQEREGDKVNERRYVVYY